MNKNFLKFTLSIVLLFVCAVSSKAMDFTLKIKPESATFSAQDDVRVKIVAERITRGCNYLKPFNLNIEYPGDNLEFKEIVCNSQPLKNQLKVNKINPSLINITYLAKSIINLPYSYNSNNNSYTCEFCELLFNVKNKSENKTELIKSVFTDRKYSNQITSGTYVNITATENSYENAESAEEKITKKEAKKTKNKKPKNKKEKAQNGSNKKEASKKPKKKRKNRKKKSKKNFSENAEENEEENIDDDDDDSDGENENTDEFSDKNTNSNKNFRNNYKIYLIILFIIIIVIILAFITYIFIKSKIKDPKNTKNTLNKPLH